MLPLRDINPASRFPIITIAIIVACVAVFVLQWLSGLGEAIIRYGFVPAELYGEGWVRMSETAGEVGALPPIATAFTALFMHGGWMHLIGNLWFLWIFGDNVEDKMGHIKYLLFYLLCGATATFVHFILDPSSPIPLIGASGAISGVMGAYLMMFPSAKIQTLLIFIFYIQIVKLPALLVIGMWIFFQILYGLSTLGDMVGVAYFAHIGGFIAGIAFYGVFASRKRPLKV